MLGRHAFFYLNAVVLTSLIVPQQLLRKPAAGPAQFIRSMA
jgi:hypothetical protein